MHGTARADLPSIAESLNTRFARLNRQLRAAELPRGMTPERLNTLATISATGPIAVSALAEREQVRPASMSRMVSALVADGHVRREYNTRDGRGVLVSLTPHGRRQLAKAQKYRLERLSVALKSLPPEELALMQELAGALEKLSKVLNGPE